MAEDLTELRAEGWKRLLAAARRSLERTGGALDRSYLQTPPMFRHHDRRAGEMPDITYYAHLRPGRPATNPIGLFRVINTESKGAYGAYQELRRDLAWHQSDMLYRYF